MKNILISIALLCSSVNGALSQTVCDSIYFYSDTIYVTQASDDSIRIKFNYDWTVNPTIAYPSFFVSLSDTSNIIINEEFLATFLGQQDSVDFEIIYKNPSIPSGYMVTGSFDIHDPNTIPTLICQFPLVIIFSTPLSVEQITQALQFHVYPNPFNSLVMVDVTGISTNNLELRMFNTYGQVVMEKRFNGTDSNNLQLNIEELPTGIYLLQISDGNNTSVSRLEKN